MDRPIADDPYAEFRSVFHEIAANLTKNVGPDVDEWFDGLGDEVESELFEAQAALFRAVDTFDAHRGVAEELLRSAWEQSLAWMEIAAGLTHVIANDLSVGYERVPHPIRDAYVELLTRAESVAREIQALLRAGFPNGAMARWRTLHEIAVVAAVIHIGGRNAAARYRNHRFVTLAREGVLVWGADSSDADLAYAKRESAKFIRRYGPDFKGSYGWAAQVTKRKLGVAKPHLGDLERLAALRVPAAVRRRANHDVHGSTLGNLKLAMGDGTVHGGAILSEDHPYIAMVTIGSLIEVVIGAIESFRNYAWSDRRLDALAWIASEVGLTARTKAVTDRPPGETDEAFRDLG